MFEHGNSGCPLILRTDLGTENSQISVFQPVLRHYHTDSLHGSRSFRYGRSVSNQVMNYFDSFHVRIKKCNF